MNFGSRGGMTVRVTFKQDDGSEKKILFGNSYKHWTTQMVEYTYRTYGHKTKGWRYEDVEGRVLEVEKSLSKWVGWGGLKWIEESIFQTEELNREGCQPGEPDNPKPRQYKDFKFEYSNYCYRAAIKALKEY